MIKVNYWPRELRLTMEGHAVTDENEQTEDGIVVCSGASMLMFALMNALDGFKLAAWVKNVHYYENGNGFAYAKVDKPKWHKFKAVRVAFGMAFGGLAMLAKHYPKLVSCEVCTGKPYDDKPFEKM